MKTGTTRESEIERDAGVIAPAWEGFRATVLRPDAPEHQVRAMRLAFHAGAHALLNAVVATACRTGATDDVVAELLMRIDAELKEAGGDG